MEISDKLICFLEEAISIDDEDDLLDLVNAFEAPFDEVTQKGLFDLFRNMNEKIEKVEVEDSDYANEIYEQEKKTFYKTSFDANIYAKENDEYFEE